MAAVLANHQALAGRGYSRAGIDDGDDIRFTSDDPTKTRLPTGRSAGSRVLKAQNDKGRLVAFQDSNCLPIFVVRSA
jgi:hypothetical protein